MAPHSHPLEVPERETEPIEVSPPEPDSRVPQKDPRFSITIVGGIPM